MNRRTLLKAIAGLSAGVSTSLLAKGSVEAKPSQIPQVGPTSSEGGSVIVIHGDFCTEEQVFREVARLKCEDLI